MIRKSSYRGVGAKVPAGRPSIPFDGLTFPGALFTVLWLISDAGHAAPTFSSQGNRQNRISGYVCLADARLQARNAEGGIEKPQCAIGVVHPAAPIDSSSSEPRGLCPVLNMI